MGLTQRRVTRLKLVSVTFIIINSHLVRYCRLAGVIVARLVFQRSDSERRVVRDNGALCVLTVRAGGPLRLLACETTHDHTPHTLSLAARCRYNDRSNK